jgi:hypothetical protein
VEIIWTRHAEDWQKEWERRLRFTKQEVEEVIISPEQVVPGDIEVLVAQTRIRGGLLRIPFIETEGTRRILTVYWTSQVERYWKE